jgi:hypothetical protein
MGDIPPGVIASALSVPESGPKRLDAFSSELLAVFWAVADPRAISESPRFQNRLFQLCQFLIHPNVRSKRAPNLSAIAGGKKTSEL